MGVVVVDAAWRHVDNPRLRGILRHGRRPGPKETSIEPWLR